MPTLPLRQLWISKPVQVRLLHSVELDDMLHSVGVVGDLQHSFGLGDDRLHSVGLDVVGFVDDMLLHSVLVDDLLHSVLVDDLRRRGLCVLRDFLANRECSCQ